MTCKTKRIRLGICYIKLPEPQKIDLCTSYDNYNKLASYGRPASSSSDFDETLAYALCCVQQESLTLNEHFRDIFLYFH